VAMSASQESCVDCGFQLVVAGTFAHAGGGSKGMKGGVKSTRRKVFLKRNSDFMYYGTHFCECVAVLLPGRAMLGIASEWLMARVGSWPSRASAASCMSLAPSPA
jgi:hypothetical protein